MRKMTLALATAAMILPTLAVSVPADAHRRNYRHSHRQTAYRETAYREYQGQDGRTYCRRSDGTTGLIVGGVAGVLAGRAIDTTGDRTLGTLGGAAAGALLGREVDRNVVSKRRCQ